MTSTRAARFFILAGRVSLTLALLALLGAWLAQVNRPGFSEGLVDPLVALVIAGAIIVPTLQTIAGSHRDLVWPANVACGHGPAESALPSEAQ